MQKLLLLLLCTQMLYGAQQQPTHRRTMARVDLEKLAQYVYRKPGGNSCTAQELQEALAKIAEQQSGLQHLSGDQQKGQQFPDTIDGVDADQEPGL